MRPLNLVFWPAPVRLRPFWDHVHAAAAGGFTSLSIAPTTFSQARAGGLSVADVKAMAGDCGVELRHFDTLASWTPFGLDPGNFDQEMNERWTTPLDRVADAWAVVGGAAQDNSGILMDSWHFFKARQSLDALADIPGRCLRTMQISDAPVRQISAKLIEDTIRYRRWPGQGELPLTEFIRAVHAKGHLQAIGQEVFSLEADAMDPREAGRVAGRTAWDAYRKAGVPVPARDAHDGAAG